MTNMYKFLQKILSLLFNRNKAECFPHIWGDKPELEWYIPRWYFPMESYPVWVCEKCGKRTTDKIKCLNNDMLISKPKKKKLNGQKT